MTNFEAQNASEELDESDLSFDLDGDLQKLSLAAMSTLAAITDEVNEIERNARSPGTPPVVESREDQANSIIKEKPSTVTPSPSKIKHIDDIDISETDDDDLSLDFSLDGSIARELSALRDVTRQIEQELSNEDSGTMQQVILEIEKLDDPKIRILTEDDEKIIKKVLDEEIVKYVPKNAWERFMKRYQLEGINEQDKSIALAALCTIVWSILFRLFFKVKYGEI